MIVSRPPAMNYEPIPDGLQPAVLVNYWDLGVQAKFSGERPKRRIAFVWELFATRRDGSHFVVAKEYAATLADSSNLRAILESWRGSPLNEHELEAFELDVLRGCPCTLDLVRRPKRTGRGDYVEVRSVFRALRDAPTWVPQTPETYMPEWVAQMMAEALPPEMAGELGPDDFSDDRPF